MKISILVISILFLFALVSPILLHDDEQLFCFADFSYYSISDIKNKIAEEHSISASDIKTSYAKKWNHILERFFSPNTALNFYTGDISGSWYDDNPDGNCFVVSYCGTYKKVNTGECILG